MSNQDVYVEKLKKIVINYGWAPTVTNDMFLFTKDGSVRRLRLSLLETDKEICKWIDEKYLCSTTPVI